jgi:uncharacterized protein (DUF305 family)
MASTHSRIDSDRFKTIAIVTMVTVVTGAVTGLDWLTRPMVVADAASVQADAAPASGPVDIGFAQDMSLHHEQALTMARLALAKGSSRVRMLAQGIVDQQLKEIGYMQGWLMLWQAPGIAADDQMRWMRDAYARSGSRDPAYEQFIDSCLKGRGMPGLASPAELEALAAAASPDEFDARFLALMVRHHQGAVVMARFAAEHAELALVRGFATSMAAEQQQEMAQMLKWLKA